MFSAVYWSYMYHSDVKLNMNQMKVFTVDVASLKVSWQIVSRIVFSISITEPIVHLTEMNRENALHVFDVIYLVF